MEELFLRFEHIAKQIFNELDFKSLRKARLVTPSWEQFIDERAYQWSSYKKKIDGLEKKCKYGQTPFHLACLNGQEDIVEIIMKNSVKLEAGLNANDGYGNTPFHF